MFIYFFVFKLIKVNSFTSLFTFAIIYLLFLLFIYEFIYLSEFACFIIMTRLRPRQSEVRISTGTISFLYFETVGPVAQSV
jgi:hypothetical protein